MALALTVDTTDHTEILQKTSDSLESSLFDFSLVAHQLYLLNLGRVFESLLLLLLMPLLITLSLVSLAIRNTSLQSGRRRHIYYSFGPSLGISGQYHDALSDRTDCKRIGIEAEIGLGVMVSDFFRFC